MPRFNDILQTFQNGEVSPRMYGQVGLDSYNRSARNIVNMICLPQGGASRRVGLEHLTDELSNGASLLSFSENSRAIPFVVSESEAYVVIFTALAVSTNPFLYIYNVYEDKYITVPYSQSSGSGATTGYQNSLLTSPEVLQSIQHVQSGDVMFMTEGRVPPSILKRVGPNAFEWKDYWFEADPSNGLRGQGFRDPNTPDSGITIDAGATTGATNLTASAPFFNVGHVGAIFAFQDAGTVGWGYVTGYTSPTVVSFTVEDPLPTDATANTDQWIEGAWSTYRGFPRTCALWNGRLFFGGTQSEPDTIWGSQTYDLFEMASEDTLNPGATATEDMPQKFTVAADRANYITWMSGGKNDLLVGTRGREYSIRSFTIANIDVRPQTGYGSEYIQPIVVDDVPIYVQRGFRKLREILYDDRTAGYLSPEVTFLAEHMPRVSQKLTGAASPKIKGLAYQVMDNNILWAWDNNGYLWACTKSRENGVTAFHRHEFGGEYQGDLPRVISATAVPNRDGTTDELYLLIKKTVNGADVISFEKMGASYYEDSLHENVSDSRRIPVFCDHAALVRTHAGANFFARYKDSGHANEAGGNPTGSSTGTVSFVNGKMKIHAPTSYISYDGTNNADFPQEGCIEWTWYPGLFGTAQCMFTISQDIGSQNNLIEVSTNTSDEIILTVKDSAGANIINAANLGSSWKAGLLTPHHFSLNYNFTTGQTFLFCNGLQVGLRQNGTGTRSTAIDLIRVGAKVDGSAPAQNALISDFTIFNAPRFNEAYEVFPYQRKQTLISRLEHLEGETVQVLANGNYIGDYVVTGGEITVDDEYDTLVIGVAYRNFLETHTLEAGSGIGTAQGAKKRFDRVVFRFNATTHGKEGRALDQLTPMVFRNPSNPVSAPIDLFTGDVEVYFDGEYGPEARIFLVGDDPMPQNLTAIIARGITYD